MGGSLFGDVRSRIVVGHCPADAQEAEHPRPAGGSPAAVTVDIGEGVAGVMAVFFGRLGEQSDGASNEDQDMKDDIGLSDFFHPVGAQ